MIVRYIVFNLSFIEFKNSLYYSCNLGLNPELWTRKKLFKHNHCATRNTNSALDLEGQLQILCSDWILAR